MYFYFFVGYRAFFDSSIIVTNEMMNFETLKTIQFGHLIFHASKYELQKSARNIHLFCFLFWKTNFFKLQKCKTSDLFRTILDVTESVENRLKIGKTADF